MGGAISSGRADLYGMRARPRVVAVLRNDFTAWRVPRGRHLDSKGLRCRESPGRASLSSSNCFPRLDGLPRPARDVAAWAEPASATSPLPTGSPAPLMTMGMVRVAFLRR